MLIRTEEITDREEIRIVQESAFDTSAEADLVDSLREQAQPLVSLVAEDEDGIVGHIMLSPVTLAGHPEARIMGLGPMAVLPLRQRQEIGSALVWEGLDQCRQMGSEAVVVLGHPDYYPRFGFAPAVRFGIESEYDVPEDVFLLVELQEGALDGKSGRVTYHPAFQQL